MKYVGFDIGLRRTGAAYADDTDGILFSLPTIEHADTASLVKAIMEIRQKKAADVVVLGLPLLPDGTEGSQAAAVRSVGAFLEEAGLSLRYIDERFSTSGPPGIDPDSAAACSILSVILRS